MDNQHERNNNGKNGAENVIHCRIREEVSVNIAMDSFRPPVSLAVLQREASKILERLGLSGQYLEYAIIATANHYWSDIFASTPFERRLLLLPQCLRVPNNCMGYFDDMGLVCAGCNNCRINFILEEAEKLGYATLVADGTTLAVRLVEEGSIDAVIGVGCMTALKQSFRPVNQAAVPSLALPLLNNGCECTEVDVNWLMEELSKFRFDPELRPVSIPSLKKKVGGYFSTSSLERFFPGNDKSDQLAMEVMAAGGQRMRPLLAVLAYMCYTKDASEEVFSTLAVTIECFHKASVVHDDIQDNSDTRYDQPALFKRVGTEVAINIGDYLIGKGYSLLANMNCDPAVLGRCFQLVSGSHLEMTRGQGADLMAGTLSDISFDDLIIIYRQKTGEAIKVSLLLGAQTANAPTGDFEALASFSEYFGIAYQVRDDLTEYDEGASQYSPDQFPSLIVLLGERLSGEGKSLEFPDPGDMKKLREKINDYGIRETAVHYLEECIKKCYRELDRLTCSRLRLSLYGVTGKVFKSFIS